jgi:hypothetical protein
MKPFINTLTLLIFFAILIIGCKGKDGAPGPAGPTDTNIGVNKDGGKVSGLISSKSSQGDQLFNFSFEYNFETNTYDGSELSIAYVKNFVDGYSGGRDYAYIQLTTSSLSVAPASYTVNLSALYSKGNGTAFQFQANDNNASGTIDESNSSISDWNYDSNKKTVSFSLLTNSGYKGNNGLDASVTINVTNIPVTTLFAKKANY